MTYPPYRQIPPDVFAIQERRNAMAAMERIVVPRLTKPDRVLDGRQLFENDGDKDKATA